MQDRNLSYAIEQGYANSLPQGRRPVAVIVITVPPEIVDVNAHITKQEVRFRRESQVFGAVRRAIGEALSAHGIVHRPAGRPFRRASAPSASHQQARREGEHAPLSSHAQHQKHDTAAAAHSAEPPLVTTDIQPHHNLRDTIPLLRVIGQARQTYIIAEGPDAIYVLDQHAAHERVIFDRVSQRSAEQPPDSQRLMIPEPVELDPFQHETMLEHRELLTKHGFIISRQRERNWEIHALPHTLAREHSPNPAHALQKLLDEFAIERALSTPYQAMAATIACHSAVRAGDTLNQEQMQAIIHQLGSTPEPHRCPHGRPTIIAITQSRLEQEFQRH